MILRRLKLENFRNYSQAQIDWHSEANLLAGANAQGKSNLLEAICYLSLTTSFRAAGEAELLRTEAPHFFVQGEAESGLLGGFSISAAYDRSKRQRWRLDGLEKRRRSELVGLLHTVIFSPEDVDLVKAGPALRRRFLNRQLSQLYPAHCQHLLRYNRVVAQRNGCLRLLRQGDDAATEEALYMWDQQLAELGARIIWQRRQALADLAPLAAELHAELAGGERLQLRYKSFAAAAEAASEAEVREMFHVELPRLRAAERAHGATLIGPHRDDLLISVNDAPAKAYASQGQQRTAALACKLAELTLARQQKGEWPLLLLDDVFSELDQSRQTALLKHIQGGAQTFITSTGALPIAAGQVWKIAAGSIIKD